MLVVAEPGAVNFQGRHGFVDGDVVRGNEEIVPGLVFVTRVG